METFLWYLLLTTDAVINISFINLIKLDYLFIYYYLFQLFN